MDDKWFASVRHNLQALEDEKARRFHSREAINLNLFSHPEIEHSHYWQAEDRYATSDMFDWFTPRYPSAYLRALRRESASELAVLAKRGYSRLSPSIENQKTLVARIMLLRLEHLLPPIWN